MGTEENSRGKIFLFRRNPNAWFFDTKREMEGTVQRSILDTIFTSTLGVTANEALRRVGIGLGDAPVKRRRNETSSKLRIEEVIEEEEKRESKRARLPPKPTPGKKSISIGDMFIPLPEFTHLSIGNDGEIMIDGELYYNTENPESGFWPLRKGKEPT